ncbi:MAG TPA: hypothetical protein VIO32_08390, partial [Candidatus Baltobacteraceae bacterium]
MVRQQCLRQMLSAEAWIYADRAMIAFRLRAPEFELKEPVQGCLVSRQHRNCHSPSGLETMRNQDAGVVRMGYRSSASLS